jgi:flagellin
MKKTDNAMSQSLGRLSTGLRINKAADDASGMAIADSLKSQANGLGQAVKNANDGISIVQTADGALQEATNIVNTIKTKAIQAAQDGQTFSSRKIIQKDISKLLEEVDLLASSTSFNGKKLLSGEFTNKTFQVGSSTRETVGINIKSAETSKIGHVTTADLKVNDTGNLSLIIHSNEQDKDFELEAVNMQYDNTAASGIGALAKAVNRSSDKTGITAQAIVQSSSNGTIKAGTISESDGFSINGISMGAIDVEANDNSGTLLAAINQKSDQTGVTAAMNDGVLTLNSTDGRGIKVDGKLGAVMGKSSAAMSTFGELKITQTGSNTLDIKDSDSGTLTTTDIGTNGTINATSEMLLASSSAITGGDTLATGTMLGFDLKGTVDAETMTIDSTLTAGSVIFDGSAIEEGTTFGGTFQVDAITLTDTAVLAKGSTLVTGAKLGKGTVLSTDIVTSGGVIKAGSTLVADTTTTATTTLAEDMTVTKGTALIADSKLTAGSTFNDDTELTANATVNQDMVLKADSILIAGGTLAAGSTLGADFTSLAVTKGDFTQDMELAAGSVLVAAATLAAGSTLGGDFKTDAVTLLDDMTMSAGSSILTGSTVAKGTFLTNDLVTSTGTIKAGTTLEQDVLTKGTNFLNNDMVLAKDTKLVQDSVFASAGGGTASDITIENSEVTRLQDIDVTSQEGAQIAIAVADSALAGYNDIRSDLGSTQNQLTSTIANLNVTQINVKSAESAIRDVDFAEESGNFSKLQILAQSGSYAMSQANSSSQTVMSLLQ